MTISCSLNTSSKIDYTLHLWVLNSVTCISLNTNLISYGYTAIAKPKGQILAIICPCTSVDTGTRLVFLHSFLFSWPEGKVTNCTACQVMRNWIVCQALDSIVMTENKCYKYICTTNILGYNQTLNRFTVTEKKGCK